MGTLQRVVCIGLAFATTAGAVVRHVKVAVVGGSRIGSSWENACPDLQSVLQASRKGDEVWGAAGVCYPDIGPWRVVDSPSSRFEIPPGVGVFGGFSGVETSLAERDPLARRTVLRGDRSNQPFGSLPQEFLRVRVSPAP